LPAASPGTAKPPTGNVGGEVGVDGGLLLPEFVGALSIVALGTLDLEAHFLAQAATDEPAYAVRLMPMSA
jgi:hypothetical protein